MDTALMAARLTTDYICAPSTCLPKYKPSTFSLLAPPDQDSGPSTCRQCYSASCTSHLHPLSPPFTPAEVRKASKNKAPFQKKPSKMREVASFYQVIISRCSDLSKHKMCWTGLGITLLKSLKNTANPSERNPYSCRRDIRLVAFSRFALALL